MFHIVQYQNNNEELPLEYKVRKKIICKQLYVTKTTTPKITSQYFLYALPTTLLTYL